MKRNELILDLEDCGIEFSEKNIKNYIHKLCGIINMQRHGELIIWKDSHNKIRELRGGISAVQFIKTSSITLHSFETNKSCFVNVFSCNEFDSGEAINFSKDFFKAKRLKSRKVR